MRLTQAKFIPKILEYMDTKKAEEPKTQDLTINTNTIIGSMYAQIVGVVVTDIDITFEFVYKHPRAEIKQAHVVSRVTLPRQVGEGLAKIIVDTIKQHEAKKGGVKHG